MNLDFFTQQWVGVRSIEEFMDSTAARFYEQMFGELIYTEENCTNFFNVHKQDEHYIISDGIYADLFPNHQKIGSILPKSRFKVTERNHTGGNDLQRQMLATKGFALVPWLHNWDSLYDNLKEGHWFPHHDDYEEGAFDLENKYFKFEDVKTESLPPMVQQFSFNQNLCFNFLLDGNDFLSNSPTEVVVQRMIEGQGAPRHYDSDVNGKFVLAIAGINWFTDGEFAGRELVGGVRSEEDLRGWLEHVFSEKDNPYYQEKAPEKYTDMYSFKPQPGMTVLVNSINPYFQHGVNVMYAGNPIYSVIHQIVAHGRSPHYTYLYERD
jgi:hypothetical protein